MPADCEIVRLIQFDKLWPSRILSTLELVGDYAYAELIESYFWLSLGVELGYFPWREAELLSRHRFGPLFYQLQDFLKFRSYYVAPSLAARLEADENNKTLL